MCLKEIQYRDPCVPRLLSENLVCTSCMCTFLSQLPNGRLKADCLVWPVVGMCECECECGFVSVGYMSSWPQTIVTHFTSIPRKTLRNLWVYVVNVGFTIGALSRKGPFETPIE